VYFHRVLFGGCQTIKIFYFSGLQEYYEGMLLSLATVPLCLVSTLQVLKFEIFGRSKRGLSVANFFYRKWSGIGEN